jgi:hypothetical protein
MQLDLRLRSTKSAVGNFIKECSPKQWIILKNS